MNLKNKPVANKKEILEEQEIERPLSQIELKWLNDLKRLSGDKLKQMKKELEIYIKEIQRIKIENNQNEEIQ